MRPMSTENTAVTFFGFHFFPTTFTVIFYQTNVRRHGLHFFVSAFWARNFGLH